MISNEDFPAAGFDMLSIVFLCVLKPLELRLGIKSLSIYQGVQDRYADDAMGHSPKHTSLQDIAFGGLV